MFLKYCYFFIITISRNVVIVFLVFVIESKLVLVIVINGCCLYGIYLVVLFYFNCFLVLRVFFIVNIRVVCWLVILVRLFCSVIVLLS